MGKTLIYVAHDNLNRNKGALAGAQPETHSIVFVESQQMIKGARWNRQRLFFLLSAARHFADELKTEGFEVMYIKSKDSASGIQSLSKKYREIICVEPSSYRLTNSLADIGVRFVPNDLFLTPRALFEQWSKSQKSLKMENFYRWQRQRLGILISDGEPLGGRWNYDDENREPPPKSDYRWPTYPHHKRDSIDEEVIVQLRDLNLSGSLDETIWGTTRKAALAQLESFLKSSFANFGPFEDAMTVKSWALHHSLLSPYLNIGLLTPDEIINAALKEFEKGNIPLASCEGFIRQIIGWREYINGLYWYFGEKYRESNFLNSKNPLLPLFENSGSTKMKCVSETIAGVERRGWVHHIPRLMILSNLAALCDVSPVELLTWMRNNFIDAADWVMVPNVIGMSMHADGGRMSTKPYIAGGAYISRMSDYCGDCAYNPKTRVEDDSCPFTTLYWHYLYRNRDHFKKNHRMFQQLNGMKKLRDIEATITRGNEVIEGLLAGEI